MLNNEEIRVEADLRQITLSFSLGNPAIFDLSAKLLP
jgi:hypothetical protein